jgi:hypothetical protein
LLGFFEKKSEPTGGQKVLPAKPEEEKRAMLIDELWREREALIARAVERAPGCGFENGVLFLNYRDPEDKAWAKVLSASGQMLRLKAIAKQVGIVVEVLS